MDRSRFAGCQRFCRCRLTGMLRNSIAATKSAQGLNGLRKKSMLPIDCRPQRLKPVLFSINYVRPKGRTLQKLEFFRSL
jgi:hypothetical protein